MLIDFLLSGGRSIVGALAPRIGRLRFARPQPPYRLRRSRGAVIVVAGCLLLAGQASGRDLSTFDFSLRLPAALSKFSPYSDVAGVGGASAGSQYQTSVNPAATDWQPAAPYTIGLSPQYQAVVFERGPTVHVAFESVTVKLPQHAGTLQPAAVQLRSVGSTAGPFTLLDGDYAQLQWGSKLADRLAIGFNANYTSLGTRIGAGGTNFAKSHADTLDLRGGILGGVADHVLVGVVVDYAHSPATTNLLVPACPCTVQLTDTTRQVLTRVGTSYEYAEKSSIYFDYQYADFWNSTGEFTTHRLFSGIEHQIRPWLYARAGLAFDARGGLSPTAGIGLYPMPNVSVDIGFQSDMFRELAPELGSSKQFGISLAVTF